MKAIAGFAPEMAGVSMPSPITKQVPNITIKNSQN